MALKHDLLMELEKSRGSYLSGQKLAEQFQVSRNAVWKAINSLRQDGYQISSRTNSGYMLADSNKQLSAAAIRAYLPEHLQAMPIFAYRKIDSTNNEAKRLISNGMQDDALIIAESQSAGRGRMGRSFYSPPDGGVYLSLVLHPRSALNQAISLTTMAAVAAAAALESLGSEPVQIKWVNDLFYQGKKICGILTEAVSDFESGIASSVIVGIGINIATEFPDELRDIAGSLDSPSINRNQLIAMIAANLLRMAADPADKSYLQTYREHSLVLGKQIIYWQNDISYTGTALDIDDQGGLVVADADGNTTVLHSGEISLRLAEQKH